MKKSKKIGILCFEKSVYMKLKDYYPNVFFYDYVADTKNLYYTLNSNYCSHFIIFEEQKPTQNIIKHTPILIEINEKYLENYNLALFVSEKLNQKNYIASCRFRNKLTLINKLNSISLYISIDTKSIKNRRLYKDIIDIVEEY